MPGFTDNDADVLGWLWKYRHKNHDDITRRISIIERREEETASDDTTPQSVGAHIHLERSSTLSLTSGTATAIPWTFYYETIAREGFAEVTFPAAEVTIQLAGYYDIQVMLGLASVVDDALVQIVRVRGGVETTVYPFTADPGLWDVTYSTRRFSGVAKGVPFRSGDKVKVYVTQSSGGAVDLTSATLAVELVDRNTSVSGVWELVFDVDNFGITWDPNRESWWTTDPEDNADPALFEREVDGTILNSYAGYATVSPTRNRGIVYAESFLWGVGFGSDVHKVDPATGSSVSTFSGGAATGLTGIAYDETNLFIVRGDDSDVAEYNTSGTLQGTFAFPTGRALGGLTWDGSHFWSTISGATDIIRMDAAFNEVLSMQGPNNVMEGCHFKGGSLYVMTSAGLYKKAV